MALTTSLRCGCGNINDPWRKYCGACGSQLGLGCAKCSFLNRPDDRFCGGCGVNCTRPTRNIRNPNQPARVNAKRTMPIELDDLMSEQPKV
ncbi:MAG TPA: zinc ribbon domain-containing protein [Kofleriaceae bacterium]|nr:zinc ribbon domain-containing protein [Kofleriaceae bacterium]